LLQQNFARAYQNGDIVLFKKYSSEFLQLIADMDQLLGTQKSFLLGNWLTDAKNWATTPQEKIYYERNARNLITLWGDKDSPLHEYSCRQWSGLLNGFYLKRWAFFVDDVLFAMDNKRPFNAEKFEVKIKEWEWKWVNGHELYPTGTKGNTCQVANRLFKKYASEIEYAYHTTPD